MEERFLKILPRIQLHGRIFFRHIKCRQSREEAIAEMVALAWKRFVRLAQRGKDVGEFMFNFTRFLVRHITAGRRVVGMQKTKDVLSARAQRQHGFTVESLPVSPRASHRACTPRFTASESMTCSRNACRTTRCHQSPIKWHSESTFPSG